MTTFTIGITFTRRELELAHHTLQEMVDRGAGARDPVLRRVLAGIEELAIAGRAFSSNAQAVNRPMQGKRPVRSRRRLRLAK